MAAVIARRSSTPRSVMTSNQDRPLTRVLFVCLGNICRSPTAEGAFRTLCEEQGVLPNYAIDSAAIANYHVGKAPDPRAIRAAAGYGIDIRELRARQIHPADFRCFDYVFGMDQRNMDALRSLSAKKYHHKIHSLADAKPQLRLREVADPFHGEISDFDDMNRLLNVLCRAAFETIERQVSR